MMLFAMCAEKLRSQDLPLKKNDYISPMKLGKQQQLILITLSRFERSQSNMVTEKSKCRNLSPFVGNLSQLWES